MLTRERLCDVLQYFPDTGEFRWRRNFAKAGHILRNGYVTIGIDGEQYLAHRLIFFLEDGKFPSDDVDHINGFRSNNQRVNLRKVSRSQNLMNRRPNADKVIQVKNVYLHKPSGRYRVKMKIDGISKHFGYFTDLQAASEKAKEVQKEYHGMYART